MGLFDDPYLDPDAAARVAGNARFRAAGDLAQRKSIVLLKNDASAAGPTLPLTGKPRLYLENVKPEIAAEQTAVQPQGPKDAPALLRRVG